MEQVVADEIGVLVKRDGLPLPEGQFIAPIKRDADGKRWLNANYGNPDNLFNSSNYIVFVLPRK